jgi:peptidoglycan endopeptidase LytE
MSFYKLIPRACALCTLLALLAASASAQEARPRLATSTGTDLRGTPRLENEPVVISEADADSEPTAEAPARTGFRLSGFKLSLLNAIEDRLGTPYRLGSTGPTRFDCSGFVWDVYRTAGVDFERESVRSLWSHFAPVTDDEKYKFGTLVFFNNLGHVGIVADENGFYHASTSRGVVYSPFNEYWSKRIVGFRRVPLTQTAKITVE